MHDYFDYFVWALLLVPLFYLGMPLLIRFQQKLRAHPEFESLDFDALERSIARFLQTRTEALFQLGFEEPTLVEMPESVPNVTAYLIMLVNRQTGDKAMVTAIVGHAAVPPLQTHYVEFSTRFSTGEVFDTLNSAELSAFPPAVKTVRTQTPTVQDPRELYELHQFVMHKHAPPGKKVLYEPGYALDYLVRFAIIKSYEDQVERRWLYYERQSDCYRPTLLGAYLMTWGLLQPFKACRQAAMRRRERKVLAEFRAERMDRPDI